MATVTDSATGITTTYYYVTNLQGDVTAILNTAGAPVVTYTYDAWGNILSANGTMADSLGTLNPLRYRSYVYDHETGLYYLQSRYYDPELGRFINADAFASTGQGLLGNNMFTYCNDNPMLFSDSSGHLPMRNTSLRMTDSGQMDSQFKAKQAQKALENFNTAGDFIYNKDEQEVLDAEHLAFYKGVPVIKSDLLGDDAFSCGVIFMGNDVDSPQTVQHEYGHSVHFSQLGLESYVTSVFIPSVTGYWLGVDYKAYYSLPYEYIADKFGGVVRDNGDYIYSDYAAVGAAIYWAVTSALSKL